MSIQGIGSHTVFNVGQPAVLIGNLATNRLIEFRGIHAVADFVRMREKRDLGLGIDPVYCTKANAA
jgi:hypothetical protein